MMVGFLIEYNRRTRARRVTEYATPREAMQRRLALEVTRTDADIEIAALASKSLETLQQTHSRYFSGSDDIEDPAVCM
jgi:hypothetical protein